MCWWYPFAGVSEVGKRFHAIHPVVADGCSGTNRPKAVDREDKNFFRSNEFGKSRHVRFIVVVYIRPTFFCCVGYKKHQEEEEDRRDYDMHRLAREDKLKGKKLRGKRKRMEAAREKAPGQDFRVDVADERFAALLEGDTRFGIDRTDSNFKVSGLSASLRRARELGWIGALVFQIYRIFVNRSFTDVS